MFENAARMKLRFSFRGQISVEDLWDLTVEDLDGIFKSLSSELKDQKGESLLEKKTKNDEILELKVGIIKHIVMVKLKEQEMRENEIIRSGKKQKLLGILAEKQDEQYRNLSIEDLTERINEI